MVDSLGGFKKAVHSNEWAAFFCALKEHFLSAHFIIVVGRFLSVERLDAVLPTRCVVRQSFSS
jgi:hypothetical protein